MVNGHQIFDSGERLAVVRAEAKNKGTVSIGDRIDHTLVVGPG